MGIIFLICLCTTYLSLHYIFGFALIFFAFFHVVSHFFAGEFDAFPKRGDVKNSYLLIKAMILGKKEPLSEKYLPEQRLAYLAIAFVITVLIVSGLIKTYKNLIGFDISNSLYYWAATLHNVGMVAIILLIIAHLLAFIGIYWHLSQKKIAICFLQCLVARLMQNTLYIGIVYGKRL